MKKNLIFFLLIGSSNLLFSQENKAQDELQNQMIAKYDQYNRDSLPGFELLSIDGKIKKLIEFKSKIILLDFWASWCSACIESNPIQKEAYNRLKKKYNSDFEWINISVDKDTAVWKKCLKGNPKSGINLIASIDSVTKKYHVNHFPTLILIDANYKVIGFDLVGLMWDQSVFLEYVIYKGMSGVKTSNAMQQQYNSETKKNSDEFRKWYDTYYQMKK